jgi:hypothetical protein
MRRKEIESERRYEHSDRKIDRDDDAEVNLIDARLCDERNEQWRKDQDRSRRLAHNELDELRRKYASRDEPRISAGGGDEVRTGGPEIAVPTARCGSVITVSIETRRVLLA